MQVCKQPHESHVFHTCVMALCSYSTLADLVPTVFAVAVFVSMHENSSMAQKMVFRTQNESPSRAFQPKSDQNLCMQSIFLHLFIFRARTIPSPFAIAPHRNVFYCNFPGALYFTQPIKCVCVCVRRLAVCWKRISLSFNILHINLYVLPSCAWFASCVCHVS